MKNHVEQASASNMEDDESSSPNKGKEGIDVEGGDSDIDYKFSNATERDKLSASNKGKDISITSRIISNTELSKMMKEMPLLQNRASCCDFQQQTAMIPHILPSQNVEGASSQQHKKGNRMEMPKMPEPRGQFKEKTGILSGLVNEVATTTKLFIMEYGKNSELSQLTEGDYLKSDAMRLSPIKNLNCMVNEVNKLTTHFQDVDKDAFFRKYGRLIEIAKVEVLSPAVRALVHFWDPYYRCFSFGSIDLFPTMEEYGMLTEFPNDLYRIYFPLRSNKIIPELSKLLKIPNLERFLEKNVAGLKWKMLEFELENKSGAEKERLVVLGIFGLVLFPSQTGIISLEVVAAYIEYENTRISPVASILDETIITLNHFRRTGKGAMRCCTQLLYIWIVSHIETKKPIFNIFWWFNQRPLEIVEEEEWGDLDNQGWVEKLQILPSSGFKWRAPWVKAMNVLMSCGQRRWVPLVGITGYVSYAPALVVRQHGSKQ